MIQFRVDAIPVAQPRQRHRVVKTGAGKSFVQNYTPASDPVNTFKAAVQAAAINEVKSPLAGSIELSVAFYLPRPKAHYKASGALKDSAPSFRTSKPDVDNLQKSLFDALKNIAWNDDAQIVWAHVQKRYCDETNPVGAEIEIRELGR